VTGYSCLDQCGTTGVPIGCGAASDCTGGQVCCATTVAGGPGGIGRAVDSQCAATCTGTGKFILCGSSADCPQSNPTCGPALLFFGLQYCQ
jgi:hypothetical protein